MLPRLFVVALSVGSGPRSAASIRLFAAARFFSNVRFHFRVVHQDPQAGVTAKGYAREPAANVNGLTFRRISDPGFVSNPKSPAASFDDFVGRGDQRRRNGEAEGFGGLEVDDQLETRRLLDRQFAGLGAFQDLVRWKPSFVMPGLVPGIHGLTASQQAKTWMPGTSSAKTRFALLARP